MLCSSLTNRFTEFSRRMCRGNCYGSTQPCFGFRDGARRKHSLGVAMATVEKLIGCNQTNNLPPPGKVAPNVPWEDGRPATACTEQLSTSDLKALSSGSLRDRNVFNMIPKTCRCAGSHFQASGNLSPFIRNWTGTSLRAAFFHP
jgi:hypothetical protein